MEEEIEQLKAREFSKFKSLDQKCLFKLEHLRQTNEEALKKYYEDTKKNLAEALPKLQSNLVLHAQVVASPLDLSQKVTPDSFNFNVYSPKGEDWEKFQREWKKTTNFFTPNEPEIDLEEVPKNAPR
ncbi:hypothetical protein PVK06_024784 [Gossypium arboreum]|uniref:Uncharacterized protein n=1 Tax=Gossypium arboreum TaxID=29729 RepID=A0ABR0PEV5_GOSAR|nr:hypothetical protein PVK06_024784 [Gossypium arboreum]